MPILNDEEAELTLTPSCGSYVAFCGGWVLLTLLYGTIVLVHPVDGAETVFLFLLLVSCASVSWIRGHRIRVQSGMLEYRDGLFRVHQIRVDQIESLDSTWQPLTILWREFRLPRTTVTGRSGRFEMNLKPFSRSGIAALHRALSARLQGNGQGETTGG